MGGNGPTGSDLARTTLAQLRGRIASGQWKVGSRIPTEPELSRLLGVGRSTIREAIRSLATLGMVEPLTARGTFVRSATPAASLLLESLSAYDPAEIVGVRRAVDVEAAQGAAAGRTDPDLHLLEEVLQDEVRRAREGEPDDGSACVRFHGAVVQASGNRLLAELDASLAAALRADGATEIAVATDAAIRLDQHDRIYVAIRGRDVAAAAHQMAVHADGAMRAIHHEPVVTDLTALADAERFSTPRRVSDRGIA